MSFFSSDHKIDITSLVEVKAKLVELEKNKLSKIDLLDTIGQLLGTLMESDCSKKFGDENIQKNIEFLFQQKMNEKLRGIIDLSFEKSFKDKKDEIINEVNLQFKKELADTEKRIWNTTDHCSSDKRNKLIDLEKKSEGTLKDTKQELEKDLEEDRGEIRKLRADIDKILVTYEELRKEIFEDFPRKIKNFDDVSNIGLFSANNLWKIFAFLFVVVAYGAQFYYTVKDQEKFAINATTKIKELESFKTEYERKINELNNSVKSIHENSKKTDTEIVKFQNNYNQGLLWKAEVEGKLSRIDTDMTKIISLPEKIRQHETNTTESLSQYNNIIRNVNGRIDILDGKINRLEKGR